VTGAVAEVGAAVRGWTSCVANLVALRAHLVRVESLVNTLRAAGLMLVGAARPESETARGCCCCCGGGSGGGGGGGGVCVGGGGGGGGGGRPKNV
jgi:hypothetical protein